MSSRTKLVKEFAQRVADSIGVEISVEELQDFYEYDYRIRFSSLKYPQGLSFYVGDDYFGWTISLEIDAEAQHLTTSLSKNYKHRTEQFIPLIRMAKSKSTHFLFKINDVEYEEIDHEEFSVPWNSLDFTLTQAYSKEEHCFETLASALLDSFCVILELVLPESTWTNINETNLDSEIWKEEGQQYLQMAKRYERSRFNRALCLRFHGFECRGCGILMSEVYGPIAADVIHVHHIVPVSKMGGSYVLNPIKDLVPLCPNCHSVVHQEDPPINLDALRKISNYKLPSA